MVELYLCLGASRVHGWLIYGADQSPTPISHAVFAVSWFSLCFCCSMLGQLPKIAACRSIEGKTEQLKSRHHHPYNFRWEPTPSKQSLAEKSWKSTWTPKMTMRRSPKRSPRRRRPKVCLGSRWSTCYSGSACRAASSWRRSRKEYWKITVIPKFWSTLKIYKVTMMVWH